MRRLINAVNDTVVRSGLPVVLVLALLLRLGTVVVFYWDYAPAGDAKHYHQTAIHILEGKGPMVRENLMMHRLPVTGYFFASMYAVFGVSPLAVQLAHVVLGTLTVGLVYDLVRRAFGTPEAAWGGLLAAVYPMFLMYTGTLLSEVLSVFFCGLGLWLAWWMRGRAPGWFVLLGAVLGLGILTRAHLLPVAGLIGVWILLNRQVHPSFGRRLAYAAATAVTVVLVMTPWIVRNYTISGAFVPLTSQGGYALWQANNPEADGSGFAQGQGYRIESPEMTRLSEVEQSAAYAKMAKEAIAEDPGRYLWLAVKRLRWFWHLGYHGQGLRELFFLLSYLPVLGLALVGGRLAWRRRRAFLWLLLSTPVGLSVVSAVYIPVGRYRLPAELMLCMLGGVGLVWLLARYAGKTGSVEAGSEE